MNRFGTYQFPWFVIADSIALVCALPIALSLRALSFPSWDFLHIHILPFSFIAALWVLVFYSADLYEWRIYTNTRVVWSQFLFAVFGIVILGFILFYLVPQFGITPKTTLVLYVLIAGMGMASTRLYMMRHLLEEKKERMVCVGSESDLDEIIQCISETPRIPFVCVKTFSGNEPSEDIIRYIREHNVGTVVLGGGDDIEARYARALYPLVLEGVHVRDSALVYEDMFERVPSSALSHEWLLRYMDVDTAGGYETGKRIMDICIAAFLFVCTLPLYPFIALAVKLDDGGPVFFRGERMGKEGVPFMLIKFRSMATDTRGDGIEKDVRITRVGKFLRVSRIDEIPQLWNVIRGDISLIGPRPDTVALAEAYAKELPFYLVRYIVRPGLSGWAQLYHNNHSHHYIGVSETEEKLTYDVYYMKHRSLFFDIAIALKTARVLLEQKGR
jgi:exopolysaccharide biosynthesis polyprenyl glycosylphosphotransferase